MRRRGGRSTGTAFLTWRSAGHSELHRVLTKLNGAKGTTLPILIDGKTVIQGSGKIIDWADAKVGACGGALTVADANSMAGNEKLSVAAIVRAAVYQETLSHPMMSERAEP